MYTVLVILWLFLIYRGSKLGAERGGHLQKDDAAVLSAD